jgi:hypothetical protein
MEAKLKLKITHPQLEESIHHEMKLTGRDLHTICTQLKLTKEQVFELKTMKLTSYTDRHGALHEFTLHPMIEVIEIPKEKESESVHVQEHRKL